MTVTPAENQPSKHNDNSTLRCLVIGASHAGVNLAFTLRKQGWLGDICLFDTDPSLPYHRPPLSKGALLNDDQQAPLKSAESYAKANISLKLGISIVQINRDDKSIIDNLGNTHHYNKLILATGARAFLPPIAGIESSQQLFTLRTAKDVEQIKVALSNSPTKRVVIIGGGYIGLETAASLKKLGASVTVLEREPRLLARVTAPIMSDFFAQLHQQHDVGIFLNKNVEAIKLNKQQNSSSQFVTCTDGTQYRADVIIVGVGITVNTELAAESGLKTDNQALNLKGIVVNKNLQTSDNNIYAIGDCTLHHNPYYDRVIRLESVQNAVDQAKIAATALCEVLDINNPKTTGYDALPWFWSDQYNVKLQMVGLAQGYDEVLKRIELDDENKFSVWYFKGNKLLAVDAINHAKAYVIGTKLLKSNAIINKQKLLNSQLECTQQSFVD
ncbi:NAD(P)/FAD-dependent oxidoreductase [Shewanella donghaensis]|uniref:NAD(P)/FAD-dependent oxidoreductase n=1 Tax=Shewanella donghaensis TaxID=238836 RepID=UPI0011830D43|nr:FAD-dependent oxidoreductase [Shewanella donghaensis]